MTGQAEKKKTILKPLSNRVVAQRMQPEETVKGGIIIPDSAKQKQETAKVIAVGEGKQTEDGKVIPIPVKVGDIKINAVNNLFDYRPRITERPEKNSLPLKAEGVIKCIR